MQSELESKSDEKSCVSIIFPFSFNLNHYDVRVYKNKMPALIACMHFKLIVCIHLFIVYAIGHDTWPKNWLVNKMRSHSLVIRDNQDPVKPSQDFCVFFQIKHCIEKK